MIVVEQCWLWRWAAPLGLTSVALCSEERVWVPWLYSSGGPWPVVMGFGGGAGGDMFGRIGGLTWGRQGAGVSAIVRVENSSFSLIPDSLSLRVPLSLVTYLPHHSSTSYSVHAYLPCGNVLSSTTGGFSLACYSLLLLNLESFRGIDVIEEGDY